VAPEGNVWSADVVRTGLGRLFSGGTSATATIYPLMPSLPAGQTNIGDVGGISMGPDGAIWFSLQCGGSCADLGRVTTDGNVTLIPLAGEFNAGTGMTSGPDGNLWYSGSPNPWVVRVTPQ